MSRRNRNIIVLLIVLFLCWPVYSIWSPFEPRYHGRRITSWLADYPRYKQQDWREAEAAIRSFGTNGIPYILRHFRKGTFWRNAHVKLWLKSPIWVKKIIGPPQNDFSIAYAPEVFALIGPTSIPQLIETLKEDNPNVRMAGLLALQAFGPEAKAALPALNELLADSRLRPSDIRRVKATLQQIDPEAAAKQRAGNLHPSE